MFRFHGRSYAGSLSCCFYYSKEKKESRENLTESRKVIMAPTTPLMVAISDNPGIKHWSLFIDTEQKPDKTIIHLLGARQRYFRDVRIRSDARESTSLVELCPLFEIETAKIEAVKNIAWETPVRNEESDYSCQDFILDVLGRLEAAKL